MDELIGLQIGNFTLTREIGRGGMGTVYLAEHAFIERRKAVKVLNVDAARSPSLVRRFFDEATAASACQHEHIVSIEDCGTFMADGQPHHYIEMEFLEGLNVAAACRQSDQSRFAEVDRAVKIAAYAADALAAAHQRGIVHRDVKPENLFLARRGGRADYLKVLDFGIARLTGDLSPGTRTRTGAVMGTPEYMSPEQAKGLHPDGKSDVFSLGVVLYRMLAGMVPFHAETFSLLAVQINDAHPIELQLARPDVPIGVSRAVALAMRKVPAQRPTMLEFKELLLSGDAAPRAVVPELSISMPSSLRHISGAQPVVGPGAASRTDAPVSAISKPSPSTPPPISSSSPRSITPRMLPALPLAQDAGSDFALRSPRRRGE